MSELKLMLNQQAKLHAKQGATGLSNLFVNASCKITQLEQEVKELKATQNALALKLKLLRESAIGEDTGEIYLDLTQESEQIALYDDISAPLKQLAQHDKEVKIQCLKELADSLITGAVANHWCEKEQAGYFWCHRGITEYIKQLQQGEE